MNGTFVKKQKNKKLNVVMISLHLYQSYKWEILASTRGEKPYTGHCGWERKGGTEHQFSSGSSFVQSDSHSGSRFVQSDGHNSPVPLPPVYAYQTKCESYCVLITTQKLYRLKYSDRIRAI